MTELGGIEVAVVGGGAAGLAAAIFARRHHPTLRIHVFDSARKLGAKILVSGGGRCNVTNVRVTPEDFRGGSRHSVRKVLDAFTVGRTIRFFNEIGVALHEEEHGKLFPDSNDADTVLQALLSEAKRVGVEIQTECRVHAVERRDERFVLQTSQGERTSLRVVLATGGRSLPRTGSDGHGYLIAQSLGHSLHPTTPALAPLKLSGGFHVPLSGVSHEVELTLRAAGQKPVHQRGAMLWTHFGVSGPVVLDVSRYWHAAAREHRAPSLTASFLPGNVLEDVDQRFVRLAREKPKLRLRNAMADWLPARVAAAILDALRIPGDQPVAQLPREHRRKLASSLLAWPLPVLDSRGYNHAEVTAGGVPLSEIDTSTMASRRCPGLYLVGELLDVDGRIGGFNFQWAWSSGFVAGQALAEALRPEPFKERGRP